MHFHYARLKARFERPRHLHLTDRGIWQGAI